MNKILAFSVATVTILAFILSGCSGTATSTSAVTIPVATTTPPGVSSTTPTTTTTTVPASPTPTSAEIADKQVVEFVQNTSTFKFDGVKNSISFVRNDFSPISSFRAAEYTVTFQTAHPGHGDRNGLALAQVITDHTATICYDQDAKYIRIAACDNVWDLIKDKELPKSISGIVISGGDTAQPDGPQDVPHTFIYQVRLDDNSTINVSYINYPPSPAGDIARAKIFLELHGDSILTGDRIYATGMLDKASNTIVVGGEDGGYIRTEVPKMEVIGQVIGGGDAMPDSLKDAPRRFVYTLQKDDGSKIDIAYTVYPPSPAGDANNTKISLTFYNGGVKIGDYMMAYGTYDLAANTIVVADIGDLVKTYPVKP